MQQPYQFGEHLGVSQSGLHHQSAHWQPGQVIGVPTRLQQGRATSAEHRRGQFVREPHLTLHAGGSHRVHDPGDDLLDPSMKAQSTGRGERKQPRTQDLDARDHGVERLHHRFEPGGIAGRICRDHHELRASKLRFTSAQSAPHPDRPGDGVAREHPARAHDGQRQVQSVPLSPSRRDRRPVRAPHRHDPRTHPAATHSAVRVDAARPELRTTVETEASRPAPAPSPP